MNLLFVASSRIPTERAMGTAIMRQCEAFAEEGHIVTLLVPRRKNTYTEDPFEYHGVKRIFRIVHVWCLDVPIKNIVAYYVRQTTFLCGLICHILTASDSILYSREPELLGILPTRKKMIVELHHMYGLRLFGRFLLKRMSGIITITNALKEDVVAQFAYPPEHILVAPSGIRIEEFKNGESKEQVRRRLGLPQDEKIAVYIGSLEQWKGVLTFFDAAALLSKEGVVSVVIGGLPEEVEKLRIKYPQVVFLGSRPQRELVHNQQAADVLVVPNTARTEISARYTSPLKVFAHLTSGVPIVASSTIAMREILSDETAILVHPDDPSALAQGILLALSDIQASKDRAQKALSQASQFDWNTRAKRITAFLSNIAT